MKRYQNKHMNIAQTTLPTVLIKSTRAREPLDEAAHSSEADGEQTADVNTVTRSLEFEMKVITL